MICFNSYTFTVLTILIVGFLYFSSRKETTHVLYQTKEPKDTFPERVYNIQYSDNATNIGYIYNNVNSTVYPLYLQRIDRNYYYYIIDSSRNNVKIPIDNNNKKQELYEGDSVTLPELFGEYKVKLYDYSYRYNPFV